MKRTALILAGAAAFDLGLMAVSAQAHPRQDPSTRVDDFVNQGLITNSNSKLPERSAQPDSTGPVSSDSPSRAPVVDPTGTGGCTPGSPLSSGTANPCAPAAITDQAAQGNLTAVMPTAGGERPTGHKTDTYIYIKLDRVNTLQACRARQGEVVRHQGAQQCRLPAAVPSQGNPRPGASPPRN